MRSFVALFLLPTACAPLDLQAPEPYAHVVYDPSSGDIPLPNDVVRDSEAARLDLPVDDEGLSDTEVAFRTWLNGLDAWGTTFPVSFELSRPVDPSTIDPSTLQVWEWGVAPAQVEDLEVEVDDDGLGVVLSPPVDGWRRGGTYVVVARGGEGGLATTDGLPFGPDAAFTYLRLIDELDDYAHQRAFPGDTREDRLDNAAQLEEIRLSIAPYLAHLEAEEGLDRTDVAALWQFSVTQRVELAMDSASQRMPLPFDLLLDPDTGLVDLPISDRDDELEADAKRQAANLNGFSVSANPYFELTAPIDPDTATPDSVQLWDVQLTPQRLPAEVRVLDERYVVIDLPVDHKPLAQGTTFAVVVTDSLRAADGGPIVPMSIGHFMATPHPIAVAGSSEIESLSDDEATRLEGVRADVDALLDLVGRERVVTAWPFTTLDAVPALTEAARTAEALDLSLPPRIHWRRPAYDLFVDDALHELLPGPLNPGRPIYWPRTIGVAEVVEGTLQLPYHLDPITRRWTDDYQLQDVHFLATIPEEPDPDKPVVVFAHAIVTDRRFLLAISGELASRGYAAVAIDTPFHGERIVCVDASLVAIPNYLREDLRQLTGLTDDLLFFPPCESGALATCAPTGECLDEHGEPEDFTSFPILDLKPVGGAAFLDIDDIPHVSDHFLQAIVELGALEHSLQTEDWSEVFGYEVRQDRIHYAGMSLGAILGAVYVAVSPDVDRFVFNVPGANMVEMFRDSLFFAPQMDAFLAEREVEPGSFEEERLLSTARWLIDSVDPHSVAHLYAEDDRHGLIQMDRLSDDVGDMVIPNHTTDTLARVSGLPVAEYPSFLHGDLVIPLVGDRVLEDLVDFLDGDPP